MVKAHITTLRARFQSIRARAAGFTLLELMVAMAVMAILLVLLLNMVDSGTKLWRVNENRVDSYREARAALGIMARDLQNTISAATNTHFLVNLTAFPIIQSNSLAVKSTNNGGALFFLSALPAKAQNSSFNKSDVCQIGYFMALGKVSSTSSNAPTMNLYRYFLSSDPTYTRLKDTINNTNQSVFTNVPNVYDQNLELLARNITAFKVEAYTYTVTTATNPGPPVVVTTNRGYSPFVASASTPTPDVVEVSISAINQETAKKLDSNFNSWTNVDTAIMQPAVQTFSTRITLP